MKLDIDNILKDKSFFSPALEILKKKAYTDDQLYEDLTEMMKRDLRRTLEFLTHEEEPKELYAFTLIMKRNCKASKKLLNKEILDQIVSLEKDCVERYLLNTLTEIKSMQDIEMQDKAYDLFEIKLRSIKGYERLKWKRLPLSITQMYMTLRHRKLPSKIEK